MSELEAVLRKWLAEHSRIEPAELGLDTHLFSSGLLDSFTMIDLVSFVEKTARIRVRAKDLTLENFDCMSRILKFLEARAAA
jgi:acyl carrier protein